MVVLIATWTAKTNSSKKQVLQYLTRNNQMQMYRPFFVNPCVHFDTKGGPSNHSQLHQLSWRDPRSQERAKWRWSPNSSCACIKGAGFPRGPGSRQHWKSLATSNHPSDLDDVYPVFGMDQSWIRMGWCSSNKRKPTQKSHQECGASHGGVSSKSRFLHHIATLIHQKHGDLSGDSVTNLRL